MIDSKLKPPSAQRRFANIWGELAYVCKKIHYWLYTAKRKAMAERYIGRLGRILRDLPDNDIAIIREEGLALLYEFEGKLVEALAHRKREVELMERLHREARSSGYSKSAKAYLLQDRGAAVLEERRKMIKTIERVILESQVDATAP